MGGGGNSNAAAQAALQASQLQQMAQLNDQENVKIKRMLNVAGGLRAFKGSAMSRLKPSNSADTSPDIVNPTTPVGSTTSVTPSPVWSNAPTGRTPWGSPIQSGRGGSLFPGG